MCGIIGANNIEEVEKLYHQQKERGNDGFGAFVIYKDKHFDILRFTDEESFFQTLRECEFEYVFIHHRFATSSPKLLSQLHPIQITQGGSYFIMHNGDIFNHKELKETVYKETELSTLVEHEGSLVYNDSEVLGCDIVDVLWGNKKNPQAKGTIAFVLFETYANKLLQVYIGRNKGRLLAIDGNIINSKGANVIDSDTVFSFDYKSGKKLAISDNKLIQ